MPIRKVRSELYLEIKRLFLDEGLSRQEIETRLEGRVTRITISQYVNWIRAEALEAGVYVQPRRSTAPTRVITPTHHRIGLQILRHRVIDNGGMPPRDYATTYGIGNQVTIQQMEHGKYEFKLSELMKIADTLAVSLADLLAPDPGPKPDLVG